MDPMEKYVTQSGKKLLPGELSRAFPNSRNRSHAQLICDFVASMSFCHETISNMQKELGFQSCLLEKKFREPGSRGGKRQNNKKGNA